MAKITICIPGFHAGDFIHHSVGSALGQTYRDVLVQVAIEPPGDAEFEALRPFAGDPRLQLSVNPSRLGWCSNIASMLKKVETSYFMILPHDDLIHPDYIRILLPHLERDPSVSVAYGDIHFFQREKIKRRRQILFEGTAFERALSFFAEGGEAPPWRGVARADILQHSTFPRDSFEGLLVECEWAFQLILAGVAKRIPQTLYLKRYLGGRKEHASMLRQQLKAEAVCEGLLDHRERLHALAQKLFSANELTSIAAAIDTIVAKRALQMLPVDQAKEFIEQMDKSMAAACLHHPLFWPRLMATKLFVHARRAFGAGAFALSEKLVEEAIACDRNHRDALFLRAKIHHAQGKANHAFWAVNEAFDADPNAVEFGEEFENILNSFEERLNNSVPAASLGTGLWHT